VSRRVFLCSVSGPPLVTDWRSGRALEKSPHCRCSWRFPDRRARRRAGQHLSRSKGAGPTEKPRSPVAGKAPTRWARSRPGSKRLSARVRRELGVGALSTPLLRLRKSMKYSVGSVTLLANGWAHMARRSISASAALGRCGAALGGTQGPRAGRNGGGRGVFVAGSFLWSRLLAWRPADLRRFSGSGRWD